MKNLTLLEASEQFCEGATMAASEDHPDLVEPAVWLGVFGHAVANFIGVGLTTWLAG